MDPPGFLLILHLAAFVHSNVNVHLVVALSLGIEPFLGLPIHLALQHFLGDDAGGLKASRGMVVEVIIVG